MICISNQNLSLFNSALCAGINSIIYQPEKVQRPLCSRANKELVVYKCSLFSLSFSCSPSHSLIHSVQFLCLHATNPFLSLIYFLLRNLLFLGIHSGDRNSILSSCPLLSNIYMLTNRCANSLLHSINLFN